MTFNKSKIFSILIYSLKNSFDWPIWKWLIFSSIGALSGTLQFAEKFFNFTPERSIKFGISTLISLFLIRFLLIFLKETLKYYHEVYHNSIYGDAIIKLKDSFASTHYYRKTPGHNDKEFMKTMMIFCNSLQDIFKNIIGDECSVSIKVPLQDLSVTEHSVLVNLTRDTKSKNIRDTEEYKSIKHTLIGNTAFTNCLNNVITNAKEKHYINNKVNKTENYHNTSKVCYAGGVFPYNSELVYPIVPILKENNTNYDCLGFICIDTKKENAFNSIYDLAIVEGVADGLNDLILERNDFNIKLLNNSKND